ncbi:MAG TPA: hypothetical protein PKJ95_04800, partial [Atribacterota bacterium]|nr:hypothetical protein [Atribacterota bacterium]
GNQYKIMDTIADEVFLFEDTRLTLTKELSTRYIASKTGICQPNVARVINRLEKKNFIRSIKSHVKGEGSLITIILDSTSISNKGTLDIKNISNNKKSDSTLLSNQENLSRKKDLKKDDSNTSLNIEQTIKEKPQKPSLDSLPDMKNFLTSSKESNSNNPAINLPCPPAPTSNVGFSSLGSILPDVTKIQSPAPSDKAIIEGKAILQEKGFTAPQIQAITQRITDSIRKHTPKKPDNYFLTAIKNEKIKPPVTGSSAPAFRQIPPAPGAMVQVQKNSFTETVNRWEEEKKKDSPEDILKKLMDLRPDDLYRVILDVDNSPAGKFVSLPKIKASLYIAEFKKRFPEVTV